jgi:serine/threonine protein kinase
MQVTTANSRVGRTFGKYSLNRLLGTGGMGEVYEAYDTDKRRIVALKILRDQYAQDEQFRTRFQRESHAAAILQEPHVIPIHDWGEIDGNLYIDMRLVRGQTLHELLKKGALEPERAVAIISQIAAALDAAHAEGLIHRDVKPQNIIVSPGDFAYLLDFGIAEAKDETRLTMAGYQIGSFDYMAPERFHDRPTTPAADVYSLAGVLHQALTGHPPFPTRNLEQAMGAHVNSPPPRPSLGNPHVPVAFDDVIARGMAKEPDDRYGSAGALGRAAQRALKGNGHSASQTSTVSAARYAESGAGAGRFNAQAGSPATGPTPLAPTQGGMGGRPGTRGLIAVVAVASAALLGAVGVVIGILVNQRSERSDTPAPSMAYPTQTTYTAAEPGSSPTESPSSVPAPSITESAPQDPEAAAQQLRQLAASDRPFTNTELADRWVPQLSSKRPGVVDAGVVWDDAMTLQEHLQLRQRYPDVRLLWSGDWSTFSGSDYWVTVVGITFPDSSGALAWCRSQRLDNDHCIAKLIGTTQPVDGSTAYN